jgi:hypothetical protein
VKPEKGSDIVNIPITFDSRGGSSRATIASKSLWVLLVFLFWLVSSIFTFVAAYGFWKWGYPILASFGAVFVSRFLIIRERFYKSKRKELIENEYMFNHSIFWNIYEISARYPHIAQYGNGLKGIFVALDKDVIVGRATDYDYTHHEAIANAYQQMEKRGIECIHIDYMDTVGKDDRMVSLFKNAELTENPDLRSVLMRIYDNIEYTMNRAYASYDVYCFYSRSRDDLFWDELQIVLDYFRQANYIRSRVLNREDISLLSKSIMNIDDFSVNRASDNLFKELHKQEHIRPIWVEKDSERTILGKTTDEIQETRRVQQSERGLKKKSTRSKLSFRKKKQEDDDIDLFN